MFRRPKVDRVRQRLVDPERGEKLMYYLRLYATGVDAFVMIRSSSIELFKLALNSRSLSDDLDLKIGEHTELRFKKLWHINSYDLGMGNAKYNNWVDEDKWQAAHKLLRALRYNKLLPGEDKLTNHEFYANAGILYI